MREQYVKLLAKEPVVITELADEELHNRIIAAGDHKSIVSGDRRITVLRNLSYLLFEETWRAQQKEQTSDDIAPYLEVGLAVQEREAYQEVLGANDEQQAFTAVPLEGLVSMSKTSDTISQP